MIQLLKGLGWGLIVVAVAVVAYPFFVLSVKFNPLINALPAGVLVALGAQLLTQSKNLSDVSEKRSLSFSLSHVLKHMKKHASFCRMGITSALSG
jgi:hypothetical protein